MAFLRRDFFALSLWIAPLTVGSFQIDRFNLNSKGKASVFLPKATIAKSDAATDQARLDWHPPPATFDHHTNGPDVYHRQPYSFFHYGSTPSNKAPELTDNGNQSSTSSDGSTSMEWHHPPAIFPTYQLPPIAQYLSSTFFQYGGIMTNSIHEPPEQTPNFVEASIEWYPPPQPFSVYRLPPLFHYLPILFEYGKFQIPTTHLDSKNGNKKEKDGDKKENQGQQPQSASAAAPPKPDLDLPTYDDVVEAAEILDGVAHVTPVETSRTLDEQLGVSVFFKCENRQRMGAFKFRGGYNALSHLTKEQRKAGVLTFSSGNHAQAIALSSKLLGCKSTIIMPQDAPGSKVAATKGYGGNVIIYDRYTEDRAVIAQELSEKEGAVFVPPYDDKYVIAGQGTAGRELIMTLEETQDVELDYLFVCVGGGGLISGCALAAKALCPNCKVIGVEPEAGNDAQQSLKRREIVTIPTPATIADGAQTQYIGKLTFEIMKDKVDCIITVSDEELVDGMKFFGERMKMIVEPTGCLGLAGLRKMVASGAIPKGSKCGVIISGGNVDLSRYSDLVSS